MEQCLTKVPIRFTGKKFRMRTVWVEGRPTKIPGLFISPQFVKIGGDGKPIFNKKTYRIGTIDGYYCWDFKRLHQAHEYVELCLEIGLKDFRPKGRDRRNMRIIKRNRNHPTVKKYFTMYHI